MHGTWFNAHAVAENVDIVDQPIIYCCMTHETKGPLRDLNCSHASGMVRVYDAM